MTSGEITRVDTGETLFVVDRNYSSFPFAWVEGHENGHDYLVCGADYQGQTVLELDTGMRKDFLPEEAKQGGGFCWVSYRYETALKALVVHGCIWACPFEVRFYDFSDPMGTGWPELQFPEGKYGDSSEKEPEILPDGTIRLFETRTFDDEEEIEGPFEHRGGDPEEDRFQVVVIDTYVREGLNLVLKESWIDPKEATRRENARVAREKWDREWAEYKVSDPLYLLAKERVASDGFLTEADGGYVSIGRCYEGWCPYYKGEDARVCRRLIYGKGKGLTLDLEWGRKEAPILLVAYRDGKDEGKYWFERSVEGMNRCFDFAKGLKAA